MQAKWSKINRFNQLGSCSAGTCDLWRDASWYHDRCNVATLQSINPI